MNCVIVRKSGRVALVTYRDYGGLQGRVIPVEKVDKRNLGDTIELSWEVLDAGIEHGLDFSVILPHDIVITPKEVTQALRSHGIWTQEDLSTKSREVSAALSSLVSLVQGQLTRAVRDALGR